MRASGDIGPEPPRRKEVELVPAPYLSLDGFEGPLDLLLELARAQKVDLARISILALVEQYLAVVEQARGIRLELAADWLVMAAWLAWLKSRLLLPAEAAPDEDAEEAASLLQDRLIELDRMRVAAAWIAERPQLRRDVHPRGAAESLVAYDRSGLVAEPGALIAAYVAMVRRQAGRRVYRPKVRRYWSVQDALSRLRSMLGDIAAMPGWQALSAFLPETLEDAQGRRGALAGALLASLELARGGELELKQDEAFGEIMLRPGEGLSEEEAA